MLSLNQCTVQWQDSKQQLEIQRKKGKKGSYVQLEEQRTNVSGYLEVGMIEAVPLITYRAEQSEMFYPLLLREEATYLITALIPKRVSEQATFTGPFADNYANQYIEFFPRNYWKEKKIGDELFIEVMGELNTKNFVGILDLSLDRKHFFICEIAAKKINYENDYRDFLNKIAEESSNLIMQFGGLSYSKVSSSNTYSSEFSQIIQLRSIMKDLPLAMDTIMNKLHNKLDSVSIIEPIGMSQNPNGFQMISKPYLLELQTGGILKEKFSGYTPRKLIAVKRSETIDTPENRYIKNFLEELDYIIHSLKRSLERIIQNDKKKKIFLLYATEVNSWLTIVEDYLNSPTFRQIGKMEFFPSNSQVLQNRAGYQDIFLLDLRLQSGLSMTWNPLEAVTSDIYVKPIYELYEIWCFFALRSVLRDIFGSEDKASNVWSEEKGNINFNLKKGTSSCLVFQKNNAKIMFYYNKEFSRQTRFGKSYSLKFKPDFTLYIADRSDIESGYFIHFDSKYKIEHLDELQSDSKMSKKEDLVKMHAYKDGIIRTLGSFVLYPGNEFKNYQEGDEILPGIGAIPLSPNDDESKNNLKNFIEEIFSHLLKLQSVKTIES